MSGTKSISEGQFLPFKYYLKFNVMLPACTPPLEVFLDMICIDCNCNWNWPQQTI